VSATDIQVMDVLGWNASGVSDTVPADTGSDVGGGDGRLVFARDEAPTRTGLAPSPSRSTRASWCPMQRAT
jgi:hypothetical protein